MQFLSVKSYQDFSSVVYKYWLSRAQDQCKQIEFKLEMQRSYVMLDMKVNWVRRGGLFRRKRLCWYYTGSQVYRYKLGKDNLYTVTRKFVRDKLMMQVGVA